MTHLLCRKEWLKTSRARFLSSCPQCHRPVILHNRTAEPGSVHRDLIDLFHRTICDSWLRRVPDFLLQKAFGTPLGPNVAAGSIFQNRPASMNLKDHVDKSSVSGLALESPAQLRGCLRPDDSKGSSRATIIPSLPSQCSPVSLHSKLQTDAARLLKFQLLFRMEVIGTLKTQLGIGQPRYAANDLS